MHPRERRRARWLESRPDRRGPGTLKLGLAPDRLQGRRGAVRKFAPPHDRTGRQFCVFTMLKFQYPSLLPLIHHVRIPAVAKATTDNHTRAQDESSKL